MISIVYDVDRLRKLLTHKSIWPLCSSDGDNIDLFMPIYGDNIMWLEFDGYRGAIMLQKLNDVVIEIHPYLHGDYRVYCRLMMREFYEWFDRHIDKQFLTVRSTIPFTRKIVHNFAIKVGFVCNGIEPNSYRKNGKIYDRWIMGISRADMRSFVKWAE